MRILMPVDSSDYSRAAVEFVASRARWLPSPTTVALVNIQLPVSFRVARAVGREIVEAHHEAEAARALQPACEALQRAGVQAAPRFVVGSIADDLAKIVADDRADLIVMGSHGETGFTKLLWGSVTSTVAASCTKPLLILRDKAVPANDSLKVGIALDGSAYGLAAIRFVVEHRRLLGPAPVLSLIHVVPDLRQIVVPGWIEREVPTGIRPEQAKAMQAAAFDNVFQAAHAALRPAGIEASEVRLVAPSAGEAIAAHTSQSDLDLLVMGSLGYGASRVGSVGSVATRVAERCSTSLLLVRTL